MATTIMIFLIITFSLFPSLLSSSSSAISASQTLNLHGGYSITASSLSSTSLYNASGTLLAPPDSAFSSLLLRHHPTPLSLLLSHTFRNLSPLSSTKIVHPNIYTDENLTVHGIDRLLTSSLSLKAKSRLLDRTARVLRRKGFRVVSIGLSVKKPDLLTLDDVTVFATSDKAIFSGDKVFTYDFLCHVAPRRYRLDEIRRQETIETLSKKTIKIKLGLKDGFSEIYHNRWIIVIGVSQPLRFDDVAVIERGSDDVVEFRRENDTVTERWSDDVAEFPDGVYGEEDTGIERGGDDVVDTVMEKGSDDVAFVSEKVVVESAPSHEVNCEPLDGRLLKESTVRRKLREFLSGVGRNREAQKIAQFQLADDLFYYT